MYDCKKYGRKWSFIKYRFARTQGEVELVQYFQVREHQFQARAEQIHVRGGCEGIFKHKN